MYVKNVNNFNVSDCEFSDNIASNFGGAVFVDQIGEIKFNNITGIKNNGDIGGFIFSNLVKSFNLKNSQF